MKQKRKLFDELMEGVDAMQKQREGKITLRSHVVKDLSPLEVDAEIIHDTLPDTLEKLSESGNRAA